MLTCGRLFKLGKTSFASVIEICLNLRCMADWTISLVKRLCWHSLWWLGLVQVWHPLPRDSFSLLEGKTQPLTQISTQPICMIYKTTNGKLLLVLYRHEARIAAALSQVLSMFLVVIMIIQSKD